MPLWPVKAESNVQHNFLFTSLVNTCTNKSALNQHTGTTIHWQSLQGRHAVVASYNYKSSEVTSSWLSNQLAKGIRQKTVLDEITVIKALHKAKSANLADWTSTQDLSTTRR